MRSIEELVAEVYGDEFDTPETVVETRVDLPRGRAMRSPSGKVNQLSPDTSAWGMILARMHSIAHAVAQTCFQNRVALEEAVAHMARWMRDHDPVRVVGAGRALLAASMPANRLAHGGAQVSFMGGMVPMPNTDQGGGLIACSASGQTVPVLEAMRIAKSNNPRIVTIGLAWHDAGDFERLCDVFIGIRTPKAECPNPLSALADTEEYVICEILDGLVVQAGSANGFDDDAWRRGHEDLGPTGPYSPRNPERGGSKVGR